MSWVLQVIGSWAGILFFKLFFLVGLGIVLLLYDKHCKKEGD